VSLDPSTRLPGLDRSSLSDQEQNALRLAYDLQDRVRRERAVIRRLRAYLDRSVDPTEG
jgi:hypothetical protein